MKLTKTKNSVRYKESVGYIKEQTDYLVKSVTRTAASWVTKVRDSGVDKGGEQGPRPPILQKKT